MKYLWILFAGVGSIALINNENIGWVYVSVAFGLCMINLLKNRFPFIPMDGEE